jgi:hypothetical protein
VPGSPAALLAALVKQPIRIAKSADSDVLLGRQPAPRPRDGAADAKAGEAERVRGPRCCARRPAAAAPPQPRLGAPPADPLPAPRAQEQDRQQQDATNVALQQLLKKLRRGSNLAEVSHTVLQLVELLLGSRPHVREFVSVF